jgi:hypothetical protein
MSLKKIQMSAQNPIVLAFGFTKNASLPQKLTKNPYFSAVKPTFQIGYT